MADRQTSEFIQLIEAYKKAPPDEKAQLKSLLSLFGLSHEEIAKLETTFAPKNPFRDKQRALESLDRDFESAAKENASNQKRVEELRRIYEEEKKKIIES